MPDSVAARARLFANGPYVVITLGPSSVTLPPPAARFLASQLLAAADQAEALVALAADHDARALLAIPCAGVA